MLKLAFRVVLVLCLVGVADAGGFGTSVPPPQGQGYPDPAYKTLGDCILHIIAKPPPGQDPCIPEWLRLLMTNLSSAGKLCVAPKDDPNSDQDMGGAARHGPNGGKVSGADVKKARNSSALALRNGSIVFNGDSFKEKCKPNSGWSAQRKEIHKKFLVVEECFHSAQRLRRFLRVVFGFRAPDPAAPGLAGRLDSGREHYYEIEGTAFAVDEILKAVEKEANKPMPDASKISDMLGEAMAKVNDELGPKGPYAELCYWLTVQILTSAASSQPAVQEALDDWQRCKTKFDTAFNSLNAALGSRGFAKLTK